MMNKYLPKFKAMVVTHDPMTNPADGWVTGFYYEDLCLDEQLKPVYDQKQLESISEICAVDTVISHTAPPFCEMTSYLGIQNLLKQDKDLLQDIQAERKVMDNICAFLKGHNHPIDKWYYGHFHQSWHSEIDGIRYNMLDCMELKSIEK